MNRPVSLKISFLLVGMALCAILTGLVLRFTLPRPKWIEIGELANFPPADRPYEIFDPVHVYVINDDSHFLVLEPLNQINGGFRVRWRDQEGAFIDPMRGTWFDLHGLPRRGASVYTPIENQSLARYRLKLENDTVFIDLTKLTSISAR